MNGHSLFALIPVSSWSNIRPCSQPAAAFGARKMTAHSPAPAKVDTVAKSAVRQKTVDTCLAWLL
jgi:hypothetical protein